MAGRRADLLHRSFLAHTVDELFDMILAAGAGGDEAVAEAPRHDRVSKPIEAHELANTYSMRSGLAMAR